MSNPFLKPLSIVFVVAYWRPEWCYMRRFFEAYPSPEFLPQAVAEIAGDQLTAPVEATTRRAKPGKENFLQQLVAEIPWDHHVLMLDKQAEAER